MPKPLLFLLLLIFTVPTHATEITGRATVIDGDTLSINGINIRLNGIDAPEYGQKCRDGSNKSYPCGKLATQALKGRIFGDVRCTTNSVDNYGRHIATCHVGDEELNAAMVKSGWAFAFTKYSQLYVDVERIAKFGKLGIWQGTAQKPWDYRAAKWDASKEIAPDPNCPIKGNVSRHGTIYHAPWSPWYKRTKINPKNCNRKTDQCEQWFCNEGEALAAGWRAPIWGN